MTDTAGPAASDADVAGRWLAAQQDVAGRAAHELKNSLNAVAVNLEVVRTRLSRPGVQAEQVQRFAESAAEQFEVLTAQVEALLGLTRAPVSPADVGLTVGHLLALRRGGATTSVTRGALTGADALLTRLLIATSLQPDVTAVVTTDDDERARVRLSPAAAPDDALRALADAAGVELMYDGTADGGSALTMIFPARGR